MIADLLVMLAILIVALLAAAPLILERKDDP